MDGEVIPRVWRRQSWCLRMRPAVDRSAGRLDVPSNGGSGEQQQRQQQHNTETNDVFSVDGAG